MILLVLCCGVQLCSSQKIKNINISKSDQDIIISFDLYPKASIKEKYDLIVKASYDNYTNPLEIKRGKVKDVKPIMRISLVIDGKQNFDGYKGELDFVVEATMTYAPIRIIQPFEGKEFSTGEVLSVRWEGGFSNDVYSLMLFKKDSFIKIIKSGVTGNSYDWIIPAKTPTGNGFKVKLAPSINSIEPDYSNDFRIVKR